MSLAVKVYVQPRRSRRDDDFEEIRRFNINKIDANDFKKLFAKVCEVFPDLDKDNTRLHWKDNDGDLIRFTTNRELTEAIKSVKDGTFKLFARELPLFKDSCELHVGVVCSSCNRSIEGSRFKCLACHDYDLCHGCELIGTHLEHTMIKIPSPNTPWLAQIMQYSYTYGPVSPISPVFLKGRHDEEGTRRSQTFDGQFNPMMDRSFASSIVPPNPQNNWSLFNDSPPPPPAPNPPSPSQASEIESLFHSEENHSPQNRKSKEESTEMPRKSSGSDESHSGSNQLAAEDWTIVGSISKSKDTNGMTHTEIGTSKTKQESTTVQSYLKEVSSMDAFSSEVTSTSLKSPEDFQTSEASQAASADTNSATKGETLEGATSSVPQDPEIETTLSSKSPTEDAATALETNIVSSTTENPKEEEQTTEPHEPTPKVDHNLYYPQIRRYAEALDNLMSMGFTNEGGWLTVLVEEKRGDIIRVLDFIENNIQKCRENEKAKSRI